MRVRLFRTFAVAAGFLFGLIAAEGGLRASGWPAPGFYINGDGPVEPRDPGRDGAAYPPASAGRMLHYDYDVSWSTNEHGFRERALRPKTGAAWRVGLLGDSFTSGMGVEPHESYVALWFNAVGGQTGTPNRRPEIWNLASPMAATAHEAEILDGVGRRYQLDEVIVGFYSGNDLQENFDWDLKRQGRRPQGSRWRRARVWLREHSRLASFVWVNGLRTFATFTPPGMFDAPALSDAWRVTEPALNRLAARVSPRPLTIWYLPSAPEWDDESWKEAVASYGLPAGMRVEVRDRVRRWADERQVSFVDFTPFLRACRSLSRCTLKVDGHWNVIGHRTAADGLIAYYRRFRQGSPGRAISTPAAVEEARGGR